ncbi:MAG: hypothetical protein BWY11_01139 [Firmicutes bacterium ADurb.Bin182]|nr:MAG: hypothetical protein BWY11_01139 [Firmicutes bacterium ADurb.Bin182]
MLARFLYKRKAGFPAITVIFIISCLLVTVPTYLNSELYEVFGGEKPHFYFWQNVTSYLQHGSSISFVTLVSLPLHISINLAVLLTSGIACEKLLGAKRNFFLIITAFLASRFASLVFGIGGNGASSITWAFEPIAFYFILLLFKKHKYMLLKDPMFYIFGFLFFMSWILITLFDILYGAYAVNIYHLFATIVGTAFLLAFKKRIGRCAEKISDDTANKQKRDALDKLIICFSLLLPAFIAVILGLWSSGRLTKHVSNAEITYIMPAGRSLDELNDAGEILIIFSKPMLKEIMHSGITVKSDEELPVPDSEVDWADERTVCIRFGRRFIEGETVSVLLQGFRDYEGRKFYDKILLEYGFTYYNGQKLK